MTSPAHTAFLSRAPRRLILTALGLLLVGMLFAWLGRLVVSVDPIAHADAIYVLGGSRVDRALEALRLYREGYAPLIILSPGSRDPGEDELERQGVHIPGDAEILRDAFVTRLGLPAAAILILDRAVDNTAQEADAIKPLAERGHWTRLIVITDLPNTRRAGYAMRRVLGGQLAITVRYGRSGGYNPARWWARRQDFRATFYEAPKLLAYWMGLRG